MSIEGGIRVDVLKALRKTCRRVRFASGVAAALVLGAASCEVTPPAPEVTATTSQAETVDSFGVGTGRDGAFTATSAKQFVNSFAAITALNGAATQVTIGTVHGAAAGFAAGNLVLVWRTTGLTGFVSGTQTALSLNGDVGAYEFGRVESVAGSVVTLTNPLGSSRYATNSQIVRIPEYTTVSIPTGTSVAPYAWDGGAGGIVVFFATGAVTTTGTGSIVADGAGFRGGGLENSGGPGGASALDGWVAATPGGGAHKGEGLVPSAYAVANPAAPGAEAASTYGRGNYANGAGGGDAYNAGGGGGGNGGAGGIGGRTWAGDGAGRAVGGSPGVALTYATANHLALGGGGGAGEENNNNGSAGGNGGGVILVRAGSLTVAATLSANGIAAANDATSPGDGLGGGGAGGTIVLDVNAGLTCVAASAVGGNGASGAVDPDGPGGGGGGGVVVIAAASGACPSAVGGGANGTTPTGVPTSWGAAAGNAGVATATFTAGFGGAICTPAIIANNQCGGCVAAADCPASEPLCDNTKNTCGTCLASTLTACTGSTPTCNTTPSNDACAACTGNNGVATSLPCPTSASPACVTSGPSRGGCVQCTSAAFCSGNTPACASTFTCAACNGDNATTATLACPASSAPFCMGAGSCGKCTQDSDCTTGTHAGPFCNATTGACGNNCSTDSECGAGNWCDNLAGAGVCQPKVQNGDPVPGGSCVGAVAVRACVSLVCDTDGKCGIANGDPTCTSTTGATVCRSTLCATTGPNAGKCEQCVANTTCAAATPVCDATANTCVVCNGDDGATATDACPTSALPFCTQAGTCGACASDADCTNGTHAGAFCNTTTGACGSSCTTDSECGAGNWCNKVTAAGLCQPKVQNGSPVPGGACNGAVATRACVAGVCDTDKDCGYANGDGACTTGTATTVCRSGICATAGANSGRCVACSTSSTCSGASPVCDATSNTCVACNGDDGTTATAACPGTTAPYCTTTGACGTCTTNASCSGTSHGGAFCDTTSGACGSACKLDTDCPTGDWCDDLSGTGICQPRTANGAGVPGGSCGTNDSIGARACVSSVCDAKGNDCGYANGDGPCTTNAQCQSGDCVSGTCAAIVVPDGGTADASSGDAAAADASNDASSEAGSPIGTPTNDASVSPPARDASAAGPSPAAGTLEGGGLSCSMGRRPSGGARFDLVALVLGLAALRRRRKS
jgi:hypothetical protein